MLIILAIVITIILIIIVSLNPSYFKGKSGEKLVAERLDIIDGYKYIINNIMINENGKSRQIDHIAITEYGVFVIETKNYSGSVYGKESSNEWKQYINKKCFKFKNPIHQNYGHLEIVRKQIDDITNEIYSIVVFIRKCTLKVDTTTPVIYEDQLAQYIKNRPRILSKEQIDRINQVLLDCKITNSETIHNHTENVQKYVEYKNELADQGICPRCYGKLVKRNGKKGEFYGCSNYPKCRYIKNIEKIKSNSI